MAIDRLKKSAVLGEYNGCETDLKIETTQKVVPNDASSVTLQCIKSYGEAWLSDDVLKMSLSNSQPGNSQ